MESSTRKSLHPLLVTAAVAVILFCVVGIAAITGVLPTSRGTSQHIVDPVAERTGRSDPAPAETARSAQSRVAVAPATQSGRAVSKSGPVNEPQVVAKRYEPATQPAAEQPGPAPVCYDCGVIESIREVKQQGDGSGVGAVAGGVAGAVIGRQIGGGRGRDLATVVGAVGGAVAGHQVERRVRTNSTYQITVRMDDGSTRTFTEAAQPGWRAGERVRVSENRLMRDG